MNAYFQKQTGLGVPTVPPTSSAIPWPRMPTAILRERTERRQIAIVAKMHLLRRRGAFLMRSSIKGRT